MKIIWMSLKPYGPFIDKTINFEGVENFHIVYGHNESGKTTTLRAVKSLFFGIKERTADSFKFDGNKLRIFAKIENLSGESLVFQRRKGHSKTFLDENGNELDISILKKFIYGLDESSFVNMFGFGRDDLVNGGKDIVLGKGNIGQSLFAAGTGIGGFRKILKDLEEESQNLFKKRSPTSLINKYVSEYESLKKKINDILLQPKTWTEHEENLKNAEAKKIFLNRDIDSFSAKLNKFKRISDALPIITERKNLIQKKDALGEPLILRKDFKEERINLMGDLDVSSAEANKIKEKIENLETNIKKIVIPEKFIENRKLIDDIYVRFGSYLKETKDLPALLSQRDELIVEIKYLSSQIRPETPLDETSQLTVSLQKSKSISSLANKYIKLEDKISEISDAINKTNLKTLSAKNKLKAIDNGEYFNNDKLKKVLSNIQKDGDLEKVLYKKTEELKKAENSCSIELSKLPLCRWNIEDMEEIEKLKLPLIETVERYENEFENTDAEIKRIKANIKEKLNGKEKVKSEIAGLEILGVIPSEKDLKAERSERDVKWNSIKQIYIEKKLPENQADKYDEKLSLVPAYEINASNADRISDELRIKSESVSKKAILSSNLSKIEEDIKTLEIEKDKAAMQKERLIAEWNDIWGGIKIIPLVPREMRSWLQKMEKLAGDAEKIRNMKEEAEAVKKHINENKLLLLDCLISSGYKDENLNENASLPQIIEISSDIVEERESLKAKKDKLSQNIEDEEERLLELNEEKNRNLAEMEELKIKWKAEMQSIKLDTETSPSQAQFFLEKNQELALKLPQAESLKIRIDAIKKNMTAFEKDVLNLCEKIMPEIARDQVSTIVTTLHSELEKADKENIVLENYKKSLADYIKEMKEKETAVAVLRSRIDSLIKEAGCIDINQVYNVENRSEESLNISNRLEQSDKELRGYSNGMPIEEFISEAADIDIDKLPVEILNLNNEIKRLKDKVSAYEQQIGEEKSFLNKCDGNSAAADLEEKASSVAAQIEYYSERYIQLRLARDILNKEIENYRVKNQGPVLKRAGEIFSTLTTGSFSGLKAAFGQKDENILVGIRTSPDGIEDEIGVEGMSEGTCDQLYLSLRLASLERYMESNEPMPLIIDDVLVNFDDERAKACLKIFGEISKKNQVIYFTHHRHILDIASDIAPHRDIKVHNL